MTRAGQAAFDGETLGQEAEMVEGLLDSAPKEAEGDPVSSFSLEVTFPASWKGAYDQLGDAFLPLFRLDDVDFPDVRLGGDMPGDPAKDGVELIVALSRPFPGGVLHKHLRHRLIMQASHRLLAEVAYSTEGEGDDLQQAALDRSVAMLGRMLEAARKGFDSRCLISLRCRLFGEFGGMIFHDLLGDAGRELPLVLLSEAPSYPEGFFDWMETDLPGKAVLAELDEEATSCLTELVGKEWSCFSGSVRIYHPGWKEEDDAARHHIWRRRQVIPEGQDDEFAERRFRNEVYRELHTRPLRWHREDEARLAGRLDSQGKAAAALEGDLSRAKAEAEEARLEAEVLKEDMARLEQDKRSLKAQLGEFRSKRTVQDAVEWAEGMFADTLVFGDKVPEGVAALNPDAGPPEKVLHYLIQLNEFAQEMRAGKGAIGDKVTDWFELRRCKVSGESKRTQEEFPREWPVNGRPERFDLHMKPNNRAGAEGVRIFFKWDPDVGKVLVGWVGPHPRTVSYGTQ